ncbi:tripartite tricarboxylate transporter permease [Candidatus Micrarchaeota archaeon]|nr:tripartite tricarboxylate transporter permease [Candidatus Micrarchaeota archaeon]
MDEFVAGFILGILSGLLPGLHSNTVISALSSFGIEESALAVMIIAMFPANLVTSFIPAIFFGIPESGTVVATLPGHRMVLKGYGISALKTILLSCIIAAVFSISLFWLSLDMFPLIHNLIRGHMKFILPLISVVLLARGRQPHLSLIVFLMAGIIGYFSLNSEMKDPFLPMFSGMFAIASMIFYSHGKTVRQKDEPIGFEFVKFSLIGVFLGFFADLIPGVGSPSQVAAFLTIIMPLDSFGFLAAISSISVSQAIFSLATAASINKSRVGATAWLSENIAIQENLVMLLVLFLISLSLAVLVIYLLRMKIAKLAEMDLSKVNAVLAAYLIAITFIINGLAGVAILLVAAGTGYLAILLGVERINLMGAIILPTIILLWS